MQRLLPLSFLIALFLGMTVESSLAQSESPGEPVVDVVKVDGVIDRAMAGYVEQTIADVSDHSILKDKNVKLNWQIAQANSLTAFAWDSDKVKIGRNGSA